MVGKFSVNKVSGNFHFAPGKSFDAMGYHLHDIRFLDGMHLDFSHKINFLSFGEHHEQIKNPLDGIVSSSDSPERSFKYHVKVVAAEMHHRNGHQLHTNQFAVTQNDNETKGNKAMFPSVFFIYEISPMIVIYTEFKKPFFSFITSICAIIGGVYTVSSILDSIIFQAERKLMKKNALGKNV
jgi:hypothetical protein